MVSKKLQNKFYAALESLKDGQNDYILEALAAGAKATFEGLIAGTLTDDGTYIPPANERQVECNIGPGACKRVFTKDDLMKLIHDPSTEENEDPVDLVDHFDDRSGNRFPSYDGQFDEEPEYSMVAEAIGKLGKAICEMKTADNAPLVESIMEGFKSCFEATDKAQPMTMTVEHKFDNVADKIGNLKEQEVVYVQVNEHITVRITHDYCEYLEDGHIENGMGFPDDEIHTTPEQAMETAQQEKILNNF